MKNNSVIRALGHAALTFLYVGAVAWFMSNAEDAFDVIPEIFAGITMLTLFVISAAVTGSLVVGRPILLYLEGKKSEAIRFFGYTLGWLFLFLLSILSFVLLQS